MIHRVGGEFIAPTRSESFDLIAAKLEAAKQSHLADLNRELFSTAASEYQPVVLTWRGQLRVWRLRAARYCATLWDALRGRDPYDFE
jgi:hypothetical protein